MLVGTSLGPYEILSLLGEGGMGQVYRARDKRLGRMVALKVLPEDMMQDRERLQRFATEARAASALNHPNIVAVYDVNLEPPIPYIVTELVDGESLRQLMMRGPAPVRKLYDIVVQVADGLAAAHQIGITHRDMKPENILLTADERPKIADFGLAKQSALVAEAAPDGVTVTMNLTLDGAVVGTAGYMSPEQARGAEVDSRSDVFSFGLIVYEMATGLRAFRGATILEVLTATLRDDPAPIETNVPLPLKWTIQRCLAKEARERYSSTRDLFQELKNQRDRLGEQSGMWATKGLEAAPRPGVWKKRSLAAAGVLGLVVLGVLIAALLRRPERADIGNYQLRPLATTGEFEDAVAWSPDGSSIAYQSTINGRTQIFTRSLLVSEAAQVTRCESSCNTPLWSGDGSRLFFRQGNGVWSVGAAGGEAGLVMDNVTEFGLSRDGRTMAALRKEKPGSGHSILLSSPPGAVGVKYHPAPYLGEGFANRPKLVFSPDGKKLMFAAWVGEADRGMEFWEFPLPPGGGKPRQVLKSLELRFPMRGVSWMPD
ncbi:MAG: protein kinase, partial [Acidobacteriia bacterium]|nr:protein kinase [Terriglobia bacterium]